MLTALGSCPMWVSTGTHAHWLPHGSAYWKFVKKTRERREGRSCQGFEDSLPVWLPSGWLCPWHDRSSLDGLSHTNPSWVLALTLWIQRGLVLYYLRSITTPVVSMYLCQDNFIQHPPTCPTMREPLKILLIININ